MSQRKRRKNKPKRKGPPTLAGIVRIKTNHGKVIVDFYLDVVQGKLDHEGFQVCHRIEAAEQLHAIAPGLVAEYLSKLTGKECSHAILLKRTRDLDCRARREPAPLSSQDTPRARHEALEYLASALAAPSLATDPRVADIVRESTDHGMTVVSFLLHVMHGAVRGFGPRNRVQAACELLGHIARDELARSGALTVIPAKAGFLPQEPSLIQNGGDADGSTPAEVQAVTPEPNLTVVPAKSLAPEQSGAGLMPQEPSPTQRRGDREGLPSNSAPTNPARNAAEGTKAVRPGPAGSAVEGTRSVRPEPVEEPAPYPIRGQCSANSIVPGSGPAEADDTDEPDHRGAYDIDHKLDEALWDPDHPVHKFIEAYEEVAATFRRQDEENDNDEDVRRWISGEVPDALGKYISQYAPADPRADRVLNPKRRRRRSTPKAESVWREHPADRMRREGPYPPKRTLIWV